MNKMTPPERMNDDNYGIPGFNMLRSKINEVIEYQGELTGVIYIILTSLMKENKELCPHLDTFKLNEWSDKCRSCGKIVKK